MTIWPTCTDGLPTGGAASLKQTNHHRAGLPAADAPLIHISNRTPQEIADSYSGLAAWMRCGLSTGLLQVFPMNARFEVQRPVLDGSELIFVASEPPITGRILPDLILEFDAAALFMRTQGRAAFLVSQRPRNTGRSHRPNGARLCRGMDQHDVTRARNIQSHPRSGNGM